VKLFVRELTDNRCSFVVDDTRPDIVNLLRRTMVTEVPKMAIDEVEFHMGPIRDEDGNEYDSNAALFDEMISHRLGLVPIPTDIDHFTFRDKCECKGAGCPNCTIIYVLNKKGPCTVYSGDLQPLGDMSLKVKEELIPLVKLKEKQALLIYATAVMGTGKTHAKWQPVTVCGYMNYPKVKINNDVEVDEPQKVIASLPKGVLDHQKGAFVLKDITPLEKKDASFFDANIPAFDGKKPVEIGYEEDKFIFSFETDGSVKAKDALRFALNLLSDRFEELREQLSGIDEA